MARESMLGPEIRAPRQFEETLMAGKFEIYTDKAGQFRFRLKAGNGEVIATSEAYTSKAGAKNGIASVQKNAPDAPTTDLST